MVSGRPALEPRTSCLLGCVEPGPEHTASAVLDCHGGNLALRTSGAHRVENVDQVDRFGSVKVPEAGRRPVVERHGHQPLGRNEDGAVGNCGERVRWEHQRGQRERVLPFEDR